MRRSFLRQAFVVFASCALSLPIALDYSVPAQAATFSFSDNSCASYTLQDNGGGNFTLTCVPAVAGQFSCSINSSIGSPTVQQAVNLTANCQNAAGAISYTWTGPSSGTAGCPAIASGASSQIAGLATPGGSTALSNCMYNLSANDTATTVTPSKAVSYSTGGGGGGGGGGPIDTSACTSQGLQAQTLDLGWPSGQQAIHTGANFGGIVKGQALVIRIHTSSITNQTSKGFFNVVGDPQGSGGALTGALSASPCDFGPGALPLKAGGFAAWVNNENSGFLYFTLLSTGKSGAATLQPNTYYYLNFMQTNPNSAGDQLITFSKPSGT
jgi:hypothetical protein